VFAFVVDTNATSDNFNSVTEKNYSDFYFDYFREYCAKDLTLVPMFDGASH
jgi:hypothetical protein